MRKSQLILQFKSGMEDVPKHFVERFMERSKLVMRAVQRCTQIDATEARARVQRFHSFVYAVFKRREVNVIINFDEIPATLSGAMSRRLRVVENKGCEVVYSPHNPAHDHRIATLFAALCCIKENGAWRSVPLPLAAIFIRCCKVDAAYNTAIFSNETGVARSEWIIDSYIPLLVDRARSLIGDPKMLIVMDAARPHISQDVLRECKLRGIETAVIPGGMTSMLQSVDTSYVAKYRQAHLEYYLTYCDTHTIESAREQRTMFLHFANLAHRDVMNSLDVLSTFNALGYTNPAGEVNIRGVPGYTFSIPPPPTAAVAPSVLAPQPRKRVQQTLLSFYQFNQNAQ